MHNDKKHQQDCYVDNLFGCGMLTVWCNFYNMSANNDGSKWYSAFVYHGQKGENVPKKLWFASVSIHPSGWFMEGHSFNACCWWWWNFTMGSRQLRRRHSNNTPHFKKFWCPLLLGWSREGHSVIALVWQLWFSTMGWRRLGCGHFTDACPSYASRYPQPSGQSRNRNSLIAWV